MYANGVMIGHGASEFGLDFLTSFVPQSAVSARVFVSAGQVPRLLESLKSAVRQLEQRQQSTATASVEPVADPTAGIEPASDPAPPSDAPPSDDSEPPTSNAKEDEPGGPEGPTQ